MTFSDFSGRNKRRRERMALLRNQIMNHIIFSSLLVVLLCQALQVWAHQEIIYSEEAEKTFATALQHFKAKDFQTAYTLFVKVFQARPANQRTTAAYVMGAKALFNLENHRESIRLLKNFLDEYPESQYVDDAHYTLGLNYYVQKRYEDAWLEFLIVTEISQDQKLVGNARALFETISDEHLTSGTLKFLTSEATNPKSKSLLTVKLAEKYFQESNFDEARTIVLEFLQRNPNDPYIDLAKSLLVRLGKGNIVKVGVMLPLFLTSKEEALKEVGNEMLEGIQYAVDESNEGSSLRVELDVKDSQHDPIVASRVIQDLVSNNEALAILGPVYSNEVSAVAGVANAKGTPLVSPTANANDLASVGKYIFQANPDYAVRGRVMARYAVEKLGLKTLAVLAPIDSYGKYMAESFIEEAKRLGANVIATEWYTKGATDLKDQLTKIRIQGRLQTAEAFISFSGKLNPADIEKIVSYGIKPSLIDSLLEHESAVSVDTLFGSNGKRIADSLGLNTYQAALGPDSLENPVSAIQGTYIPIAGAEEIGIVTSQITYFNIKTQLLGTGDWYNIAELEENKRYTNGVIFDSDTYVDASDSAYIKFFDSFYAKMNKRPSKNTLFGYDGMKLLLSLLKEGATTRKKMVAGLTNMKNFKGLHSTIAFSKARVNSALNILQYKNGVVKKLDEIIVEDNLNEP